MSDLKLLPDEAQLSQEIFDRLARCPLYIDIPTAWAIQHSHGGRLDHHPRCSSSAGLLCDCDAMEEEWRRIKEMQRANTRKDNTTWQMH